ncbi:MAG: hypothetical protein KDK70_06125 [Myxococcales bacterium]|nr:hypothetical protein [Myxococcales bacterium]
MSELEPRVAPLVLTGPAQERYVDLVARGIERARLSDHYPPGRRLAAQVRAMGPRAHLGLYGELQVDPRSGLPTYREWTRVCADAELAPKVLRELPPVEVLRPRAEQQPQGIHGKQLLKHHYYGQLAQLDGTPPSHMVVRLRKVDAADRRAWFHVMLDKLDVSGLFVRFSIDLSQRSSLWNRPMVELSDDVAQETEALRAIIYRMSSLDAELTFVRLAGVEGLQVERVFKGTVGPVLGAGVPVPAALQGDWGPALAGGGMIATFGMDMAADDVARDGDNDPLDALLTERLPPEQAEAYRQARVRYGYRVFKDRKFVASDRATLQAVQARCTALGTRNVAYALRGR